MRFKNFIFIVLVTLNFVSCNSSRKEKLANQAIQKIEMYRTEHGFVPNNLTEIGIEEKIEGPFYYTRIDSLHYIVWYGTTLGESATYSSRTKKWDRK